MYKAPVQRKQLVIAVSVAVVAIVLFFVFRSGDDKKKDEKNSDDSVAETTTAPTRAAATSSGGESRPEGMQIRFDDDPDGSLRLEGQVIAADETPVEGAIVSIDSRPPRMATSEADGSFYFDKLVARNYELVARADKGVAGPVAARLSERNDPIILTLSPGGAVSVKVVSADKPEGLEGANVQVRGLAMQEATTDAEGLANFSQVVLDRQEVSAVAPGYARATTMVMLTRPGATVDVRLELSRGAAVEGRVVDAEGKPVKDARVTYMGVSDWSVRADPRFDAAVSDTQGRFKFDALPRGSFRLHADAEGMAPGDSEVLELDGTTALKDIEVRMQPSATLRGTVSSSDGKPVAAARVRLTAKSAGQMRRGSAVRQAYTDEKGRYEITGLVQKPHSVLAMHESASSEIEEVDLSVSPFEATLDLTLAVDGVIAGLVVDSQGEPVAGAQVSAAPDFQRGRRRGSTDWALRGFSQELTDAGGAFRISGLEKEELYRVRALPPNSTNPTRLWMTEGVESKAGVEDLRIVLPADARIKGKVALPDGEPPELFTVSVSWARGTPFSSKDGSFELGELPPDTFTVVIAGPSFDEKRIDDVTLSEGELKDLGTITVTRGRRITGRVLDPKGSAVAGATVSAGRILFGDGSSTSAAMQGNPMARSTKTATTDDNGQFSISGVTGGDLFIVADHDSFGRSEPVHVQQTRESVENLTLSLLETSALRGVVRKQGKAEEGVFVTAAPVASNGVTFNVASGPDGSYHFDRLVPGSYKVKAMIGGSPMRGFGNVSKLVEVAAGATATLDIDLDAAEGAELTIELVGDKDLGFTWITMVNGAVNVETARELSAAVGAQAGFEVNTMSIAGMPATAPNLPAGKYSVCAVVYPAEVKGMDGTLEYMNREGDNLPAQCQMATVTEAPKQSMQMKVVVPDFVPAS